MRSNSGNSYQGNHGDADTHYKAVGGLTGSVRPIWLVPERERGQDQSHDARGSGLFFGNPKGSTLLMIVSPLLALDLPLKALVWQGEDDQVWVSSTSAAFLEVRYTLPQELIGTIAGVDVVIE